MAFFELKSFTAQLIFPIGIIGSISGIELHSKSNDTGSARSLNMGKINYYICGDLKNSDTIMHAMFWTESYPELTEENGTFTCVIKLNR